MRRHFYTFCQFEISLSLSLSLLDSLFSFMKILFGHLRKKKNIIILMILSYAQLAGVFGRSTGCYHQSSTSSSSSSSLLDK